MHFKRRIVAILVSVLLATPVFAAPTAPTAPILPFDTESKETINNAPKAKDDLTVPMPISKSDTVEEKEDAYINTVKDDSFGPGNIDGEEDIEDEYDEYDGEEEIINTNLGTYNLNVDKYSQNDSLHENNPGDKVDDEKINNLIAKNNSKYKNMHDSFLTDEERKLVYAMIPHYDAVAYSSADLIKYDKKDLDKLREILEKLYNKAKLDIKFNRTKGFSVDMILANLSEVIYLLDHYDDNLHKAYIKYEDINRSNIENKLLNQNKENVIWYGNNKYIGTRVFKENKLIKADMRVGLTNGLIDNLYYDYELMVNAPIEIEDELARNMQIGETICFYNTIESVDPILFTYIEDYIYERPKSKKDGSYLNEDEYFMGVRITKDNQKCLKLKREDNDEIWYIILDDAYSHHIIKEEGINNYTTLHNLEMYNVKILKNARLCEKNEAEDYNYRSIIIDNIFSDGYEIDKDLLNNIRDRKNLTFSQDGFHGRNIEYITLDEKGFVTSLCLGKYKKEIDDTGVGYRGFDVTNANGAQIYDKASENFKSSYIIEKGKRLKNYATVEDENSITWNFVIDPDDEKIYGYIKSEDGNLTSYTKVKIKSKSLFTLLKEYYIEVFYNKNEAFKFMESNPIGFAIIFAIIGFVASFIINKSIKDKKGDE